MSDGWVRISDGRARISDGRARMSDGWARIQGEHPHSLTQAMQALRWACSTLSGPGLSRYRFHSQEHLRTAKMILGWRIVWDLPRNTLGLVCDQPISFTSAFLGQGKAFSEMILTPILVPIKNTGRCSHLLILRPIMNCVWCSYDAC